MSDLLRRRNDTWMVRDLYGYVDEADRGNFFKRPGNKTMPVVNPNIPILREQVTTPVIAPILGNKEAAVDITKKVADILSGKTSDALPGATNNPIQKIEKNAQSPWMFLALIAALLFGAYFLL